MTRQLPTVHLISGMPASGKTTYATALAAKTDAVLFSLDRWLITAFGRYAIASVGQEEHTRRVLACRELIWSAASALVEHSVDVVLDDGFFLREHRVACVARAAAIGASTVIHHVDTPLALVRPRLTLRNQDLPPYNFFIDPGTLDVFSQMFQVPSGDEGAAIVRVDDVAVGTVDGPGAPPGRL